MEEAHLKAVVELTALLRVQVISMIDCGHHLHHATVIAACKRRCFVSLQSELFVP